MEHETNRRFEAWLDDERCVISFHSIPDARYFTAPEPIFKGRKTAQEAAQVMDRRAALFIAEAG